MPETRAAVYLTPVTKVRQRNDAGRWLPVAATASSAFTMINSVILILLATESNDALVGPRTLSIISLVLQLVSAAIISWLAWREKRRRTGFAGIFKMTEGQRRKDVTGTATTIGVGQILTLVTIIWVRVDIQDLTYNIGGIVVSVSAVLVAFWILSIVSEATTFYLIFPRRAKKRPRKPRGRKLDTPTAQPMLSPEQLDSPKHQYQYATSNPFSSQQNTPAASPKTNSMISLHSFTLPRGASTRISASVHRSMSQASSACASLSPRLSGESAFDSWDTSSVPQEMRAAISSPSPLSLTLHTTARPMSNRNQTHPRLPPIPGSRPVSPAKPLEGPFPAPSPLDSPHELNHNASSPPTPPPAILPPSDAADLPPSPTIKNAPPALISMSSHSSLRAPQPAFSPTHPLSSPASFDSLHSALSSTAPPRPSFARRTSITSHASVESFHHLRSVPAHVPQEESQIHPLFRMTSPEPAPTATPGTVVTAVPADVLGKSIDRVRERAGSVGARIGGTGGSLSRSGSRSGSRHGSAVPGVASAMVSPLPSPSPLIKEFPQEILVENSDENDANVSGKAKHAEGETENGTENGAGKESGKACDLEKDAGGRYLKLDNGADGKKSPEVAGSRKS